MPAKNVLHLSFPPSALGPQEPFDGFTVRLTSAFVEMTTRVPIIRRRCYHCNGMMLCCSVRVCGLHRRDAKFCSDKCKTADYRKRQS